MDFVTDTIIKWVSEHHTVGIAFWIWVSLTVSGTALEGAEAFVKATASQDDDKVIAGLEGSLIGGAIAKVIKKFSLFNKSA